MLLGGLIFGLLTLSLLYNNIPFASKGEVSSVETNYASVREKVNLLEIQMAVLNESVHSQAARQEKSSQDLSQGQTELRALVMELIKELRVKKGVYNGRSGRDSSMSTMRREVPKNCA